MADEIYDALDSLSGPAGDQARTDFASAPLATETPADTSSRLYQADTQRRQWGRAKASDLANRGIPSFTDTTGDTKPIADPTGAALTSADPRNSIAYDSSGNAVSYAQKDTNTGQPVLGDPYASAPRTTDKEGNIYSAPKGLPWRFEGQDPAVVQANQDAKAEKLNQQANSALGPYESQAKTQASQADRAAKASAKLTAATLQKTGVPLTDDTGEPLFDLHDQGLDAPSLKAHIDQTFNKEYASDAANERPWFGNGQYSPAAQALRQNIDQRKAQANAAVDAHAATLGNAQAANDQLSQIQQTRQQLEAQKLAAVNARRQQSGMAPVSIPGLEHVAPSNSDQGVTETPNAAGNADTSTQGAIPGIGGAQDQITPEEAQVHQQVAAALPPSAQHAVNIPPPDDNGNAKPESFWGTAGRAFASKIIPSIATAAGGLTAGAAAIESGPGAIAADIAAGAASGYATNKAQRAVMGDAWANKNDAQMEANAKEHPIAAQIGSTVPFLVSLLGGQGWGALAKGITGAGKAAVKEALALGEKATLPWFERSLQYATLGARGGASEGVQQKDATPGSVLDATAKTAITNGALGLFPMAKTLISAAGLGKVVGDAGAMALAGGIYDSAIHGKPFDAEEIAKEAGGNIPAFLIQHALLTFLHGGMAEAGKAKIPGLTPTEGGTSPSEGPSTPSEPGAMPTPVEMKTAMESRLKQLDSIPNDAPEADVAQAEKEASVIRDELLKQDVFSKGETPAGETESPTQETPKAEGALQPETQGKPTAVEFKEPPPAETKEPTDFDKLLNIEKLTPDEATAQGISEADHKTASEQAAAEGKQVPAESILKYGIKPALPPAIPGVPTKKDPSEIAKDAGVEYHGEAEAKASKKKPNEPETPALANLEFKTLKEGSKVYIDKGDIGQPVEQINAAKGKFWIRTASGNLREFAAWNDFLNAREWRLSPQSKSVTTANEPEKPDEPTATTQEQPPGTESPPSTSGEKPSGTGNGGVDEGQRPETPAGEFNEKEIRDEVRGRTRKLRASDESHPDHDLMEVGEAKAIADTSGFSVGRKDDRMIVNYHPGAVAHSASIVAKNWMDRNLPDKDAKKQAKRWVRAAHDEELIHIHQLVTVGKGHEAFYAKMWREQIPQPMREAYDHARNWKGEQPESDADKAAEFERMVIQYRKTGTISEALFGSEAAEKRFEELKPFLGRQITQIEANIARVTAKSAGPSEEASQESAPPETAPKSETPSTQQERGPPEKKVLSKREQAAARLKAKLGGNELAASKPETATIPGVETETKPAISDRETRLAAMEYADALIEDGIIDPVDFAREVRRDLGFTKPASYAALWNLAKLSGADIPEQTEADWRGNLIEAVKLKESKKKEPAAVAETESAPEAAIEVASQITAANVGSNPRTAKEIKAELIDILKEPEPLHASKPVASDAFYAEMAEDVRDDDSKQKATKPEEEQLTAIVDAYREEQKQSDFPGIRIADVMERAGYAAPTMQLGKQHLMWMWNNGMIRDFPTLDWSLVDDRTRAWAVHYQADSGTGPGTALAMILPKSIPGIALHASKPDDGKAGSSPLPRENLVREAEESGVTLKIDELKGLTRGDPAVMAAVRAKIKARTGWDALFASKPMRILYRASDRPEAKAGAHFSENEADAKAYQDNPGFGGADIHRFEVDASRVADVPTLKELSKNIEPLLNDEQRDWANESGGLERAIRDYGFTHVFHALENRFGPRRNSINPLELLAKDHDWIRFDDDFPEGAKTWRYIGEGTLKPNTHSVSGMGARGSSRTTLSGGKNVIEKFDENQTKDALYASKPEAFYSQLSKTVESLPQQTMTIGQARAAITKGVRPDEIKLSGILTDPLSPLFGKEPNEKVSRDALQSYALERQAKVEDVTLAEKWHVVDSAGETSRGFPTREAAERHLASIDDEDATVEQDDSGKGTHFSQYQLPGAEPGTYREQFVTIPDIKESVPNGISARKTSFGNQWEISDKDGESLGAGSGETKEDAIGNFFSKGRANAKWEDGHPQYSDIGNPIVRLRRNIRTDSNGNKTLFLEEIQGPNPDNQEKMPPELRKRIYEIGMKRAIREAADEGATHLGWTTGETQADRYSLEKLVDSIGVTKKNGEYWVRVNPKQGPASNHLAKDENTLAGIIGKDIASQAVERLSKSADDEPFTEFTGQGLKVGGEGLKSLYGVTLPRIANEIGKKFGVKTGKATLENATEMHKQESKYEGPTPTQDEVHQMFKLAQKAGPDIFVSPYTGERQDAAINRTAVAGALRDVKNAMTEGMPFAEAMKMHGNQAAAKVFGGDLSFINTPTQIHSIEIPESLRTKAKSEGFALFASKPIAERLDELKDASGWNSLVTATQKIFSPDSVQTDEERELFRGDPNAIGGARHTSMDLDKVTAEMDRRKKQWEDTLKQARDLVSRLSDPLKLELMKRVDEGTPLKEGPYKAAIDQLAAIDAQRTQELKDWFTAMGRDDWQNYENFLKNIVPHYFKDQALAAKVTEQYIDQRKKMAGSGGFLKHREGFTMREIMDWAETQGIKLEPKHTNVIDAVMDRWTQQERYRGAHTLMEAMAEDGRGHWENTDYIPRGNNVKISNLVGRRHVDGRWQDFYADAPSAQIINNYLSRGLRGMKFVENYFIAANALNALQLGVSFFHAGFVTTEGMVSSFALGLQKLFSGDMSGLKEILKAPFSTGSDIMLGRKIRKEMLHPGSMSPDMTAVVDAMVAGGYRDGVDSFYHDQHIKAFFDAIHGHKVFTGVLRAPLALIELIAKPIMEYYVPWMKGAAVYKLAQMHLKQSPDITATELHRRLQEDVRSGSNRFGQMTYDNLHLHKTVKDLMMGMTRSLGWNWGTFSELLGGVAGWISFAKNAAIYGARRIGGGGKGGGSGGQGYRDAYEPGGSKFPRITNKMAYTLALPLLIGFFGAVLSAMFGKKPKDLKDYYFVQTGDIDDRGNPVRLVLPSYMKDAFHASRHPIQTITNKLHPILSMIGAMLQNRDFYGVEIRHSGDPAMKQILQDLGYVAKQFEPFTWRNLEKQKGEGGSNAAKVAGFFGITQAPASAGRTKAEELASELVQEQIPSKSRTQEQADHSALVSQLTGLARIGKGQALMQQSLASGKITSKDMDHIRKQALITPLQASVNRLGLADAKKVEEVASPTEKLQLRPMIAKKAERAGKPLMYSSGF